MSIAVETRQSVNAQRSGEGLWDRRTRLLARSAAHAALVLPAVTAAEFAIHGDPGSLVVTVDCRVRSQEELPLVARHVEETILADLENLLAIPFAERIVNFTVATAPAGQPEMTVVPPLASEEPAARNTAAELQTAS
ncbi:hypothetical protein [Arthrobacter sp. JSM 101049]|uniref:hypothetical protein n=1 Tax=Arthrobacter sp. JSM 101049 TaxID=929097 RepID=UPI0035686DA1